MAHHDDNQTVFWESMKEKYERRNQNLKQQEQCLKKRLNQLHDIMEKQKNEDTCDCIPEKLEKQPGLVQTLMEKGKNLIMGSCKCDTSKPNESFICACTEDDPEKLCLNEHGQIERKSSSFSLRITDFYYMDKLADLVKNEKYLQEEIDHLEKQEHTYIATIQDLQEARRRRMESPSEINSGELRKLIELKAEENKRLKHNIADLQLELRHCFERVEGPLKRNLEDHQHRCKKMESELQNVLSKMKIAEDVYMKEISAVKTKLCYACTTMVEMNNVNDKLKDNLESLENKCSTLEEELLRQKLKEAENILSFKHLLGKRPEPSCLYEKKPDSDLGEIARQFSEILRQIGPCTTVLPSGLIDTARDIKQLVDLVDTKKSTRQEDDECNCCTQTDQLTLPDTQQLVCLMDTKNMRQDDECNCYTQTERGEIDDIGESEEIIATKSYCAQTELQKYKDGFDVETSRFLLDKPPSDMNVTTTIMKSGSLEIRTEGPPGAINTKVDYLPDGRLEITTTFVDRHGQKTEMDEVILPGPSTGCQSVSKSNKSSGGTLSVASSSSSKSKTNPTTCSCNPDKSAKDNLERDVKIEWKNENFHYNSKNPKHMLSKKSWREHVVKSVKSGDTFDLQKGTQLSKKSSITNLRDEKHEDESHRFKQHDVLETIVEDNEDIDATPEGKVSAENSIKAKRGKHLTIDVEDLENTETSEKKHEDKSAKHERGDNQYTDDTEIIKSYVKKHVELNDNKPFESGDEIHPVQIEKKDVTSALDALVSFTDRKIMLKNEFSLAGELYKMFLNNDEKHLRIPFSLPLIRLDELFDVYKNFKEIKFFSNLFQQDTNLMSKTGIYSTKKISMTIEPSMFERKMPQAYRTHKKTIFIDDLYFPNFEHSKQTFPEQTIDCYPCRCQRDRSDKKEEECNKPNLVERIDQLLLINPLEKNEKKPKKDCVCESILCAHGRNCTCVDCLCDPCNFPKQKEIEPPKPKPIACNCGEICDCKEYCADITVKSRYMKVEDILWEDNTGKCRNAKNCKCSSTGGWKVAPRKLPPDAADKIEITCDCSPCDCAFCSGRPKEWNETPESMRSVTFSAEELAEIEKDTTSAAPSELTGEKGDSGDIKEVKEELSKILNSIALKCDEAEKQFMQSPSPLITTVSNMKTVLSRLQEKCNDKDNLVKAMTEELQYCKESGIFSDCLSEFSEPNEDILLQDVQKCQTVSSTQRKISKSIRWTKNKMNSVCSFETKSEPTQKLNKYPPRHLDENKNLDVTGLEIKDIKRVTVDSLLIKWNKPDNISGIVGYQIFINGQPRYKVPSPVTTSAVLDSLDFGYSLEVMLYALSPAGRCQPPALATYKIR